MVVDEEESMEQAIPKPMELFNSSATMELFNSSATMELFNSSAKISKRTSSIRNLDDTRTKSFVFFVALTAALGGLIIGYDIGGAGATFVMDGFREHFGWSCAVDELDCVPKTQSQINADEGLIDGLFGAGAAFGALFAPTIFNGYGRKPTLFVGALLFTIGAALQAGATTMLMLIIPRLISGFGIGMLSMCSPIYIAELAPAHRRGQLATLWQVAITAGIVLASLLNIPLATVAWGWRISYGGNILFSVALMLLLMIMPESPDYLVGKHDHEGAKAALLMVRFDDQIDWELEQLELEVKLAENRGEASWAEVFDNGNNRMGYRVFVACALNSIQQLCGINAIMFYAPIILKRFFGASVSIIGALVLNLVFFFSTFITIFAIERIGRVMILFLGAIIMCIALIAVAILSSIEDGGNSIGVGVIVFCALFVFGFSFSWGPVVWVVCAEMFPMRERGKANSLSTFTNLFWAMIVGALFPMAQTISLWGCFAFFAVITFCAIFFVYLYLPETTNRTATEIDEEYNDHKPGFPRKKWV